MWVGVESRVVKRGLTPLVSVLIIVTVTRYSLVASQVMIFFSGRAHMSIMGLTSSSRCLPTAGRGILLLQVFLVLLNMVRVWGTVKGNT